MSCDDVHCMTSNWKVDTNIVFKDQKYNSEFSVNPERSKVTAIVPSDQASVSDTGRWNNAPYCQKEERIFEILFEEVVILHAGIPISCIQSRHH